MRAGTPAGEPLAFVYLSDDHYAPLLRLSVRALLRVYPDAEVIVFDLGRVMHLCPELRGHAQVRLVPWPETRWQRFSFIERQDFRSLFPHWGLRDELKRYSRLARSALRGTSKPGWILRKSDAVERSKHFMRVNWQKPACILAALDMSTRPVVYIDTDIYAWRPVLLFAERFDVGLTYIRPRDITIGRDPGSAHGDVTLPHRAINAGLMFFANNENARAFLRVLVRKNEREQLRISEQSAIAKMLWDADPEVFDRLHSLDLRTEERAVRVRLFPCETYNNIYVSQDLAFDEAGSRFIHLIGLGGKNRRMLAGLQEKLARHFGVPAGEWMLE